MTTKLGLVAVAVLCVLAGVVSYDAYAVSRPGGYMDPGPWSAPPVPNHLRSSLEMDGQGIIDEDGNRIVIFARGGPRIQPHVHVNTHKG